MVENTRGISAKIPADLHAQVKAEQEALELTVSQYIQQVLVEHFSRKEGKTMEATRTLAFQVNEDLFQRVKRYLAAHPNLTQKAFIIGLVEEALAEFEAQETAERDVSAQEAQEEVLAGESGDEDGYGPDSATEDDEDDTDSPEDEGPETEEPEDDAEEDGSESDEEND